MRFFRIFLTALFNRKYLFYNNCSESGEQQRGRKICNGVSKNQSELSAPTDPNQQPFHGNYIRVRIWSGLPVTFIGRGWSEGMNVRRWRTADDCIISLRKSRYDRPEVFSGGRIIRRWIRGDMRAAVVTSAFN